MDSNPADSIMAYLNISGGATEQLLTLVTAYGLNFVAALLTLIFGVWLSRRASRLIGDWLSRVDRLDRTLVPIMAALVRYAGLTLTIVITLGNFGVETTSIIAVLGAAGLAVGLALQGTLSNVAAGLMLLFLRPFRIGDWVEAKSAKNGTVYTLRTTGNGSADAKTDFVESALN